MKEKGKKEILHFDDVEFSKAQKELEAMRLKAQTLINVIKEQPILEKRGVKPEDLPGILNEGTAYIENLLIEAVRAGYEKQAPGFSQQIEFPTPKIINADIERMNRQIEHLKSNPHRSGNVSVGMLSVRGDKVVIPDEKLQSLKERFITYAEDCSPETREAFELGTVAEKCLNRMQELIDLQHTRKEKKLGHRLPNKVQLFSKRREGLQVTPGEAARTGAFYEDKGKIFFNLSKFIR